MLRNMAELNAAVSAVAHNISHISMFRDHFLKRYDKHRNPTRQMMLEACASAKVSTKGFGATELNTLFDLVEQKTAGMLDLDMRRYKAINTTSIAAWIDANKTPNKPVAKPHTRINSKDLEEMMLACKPVVNNINMEVRHGLSPQEVNLTMPSYLNSAKEFFSQTTKPTFDEVKPMSLEVTRPVLVGGIDILTASDEQLVHIIREAERQIKSDEDITKLSTKFKKKTEELKEVIKLCIQQLDNEAAIVDKK